VAIKTGVTGKIGKSMNVVRNVVERVVRKKKILNAVED
jgi:hypothetical protein